MTDLFKVDPSYWDPDNQTTETVTGGWTDLGPGMPGDVSQYIGDGEYPGALWPIPSGTDDGGGTRDTSGPGTGTVGDGGNTAVPGGTDPDAGTAIGDGTAGSISTGLDVVIREGIYIASGDSQAFNTNPTVINQTTTGDAQWADVNYLYTFEGQPTSITLGADETSATLEFSRFALDIPPEATVTGIKMIVERDVISGSLASETGSLYRCAVQETPLPPSNESTFFSNGGYGFPYKAKIRSATNTATTYQLTAGTAVFNGVSGGNFSYDDAYFWHQFTNDSPGGQIFETTGWTSAYTFSGDGGCLGLTWDSQNRYLAFRTSNTNIRIRSIGGAWTTLHNITISSGTFRSATFVGDYFVFVLSTAQNVLGLGAHQVHVINVGTWTAQASFSFPSPYGFITYGTCSPHPGASWVVFSVIRDNQEFSDPDTELWFVETTGWTVTNTVTVFKNLTGLGAISQPHVHLAQGNATRLVTFAQTSAISPQITLYVYETTGMTVEHSTTNNVSTTHPCYISNNGRYIAYYHSSNGLRYIDMDAGPSNTLVATGLEHPPGNFNHGLIAMPS